MTASQRIRFLLGVLSVFLASLLVVIITSVGYAALGTGHALTYITLLFSGDKEALNLILLIVIPATVVAITTTSIILIVTGLPFFLISKQHRHISQRYYVISGTIGSLLFSLITGISFYLTKIISLDDLYFAVVSILITGPIAAFAFWNVVRPDRLPQAKA